MFNSKSIGLASNEESKLLQSELFSRYDAFTCKIIDFLIIFTCDTFCELNSKVISNYVQILIYHAH
jgi:hypothetical protein